MGTVASNNTPATDLAFDRVAELIVADEIDVPNRSVFIPADIPAFGSVMKSALLEDKPIVVIYPDGYERVIEPVDASHSG